jgi:AmmeMemoRadiSam system protein A
MTLDAARRAELLGLAREAIAHALAGLDPRPTPAESAPGAHGGVFVSVYVREGHELRGCIGSMRPGESLSAAVADSAVAAATRDRRFQSLRPDELAAVGIQISVLEPLRPIRPDEVEVGLHGLLVRQGGRSGVLLPQVAVEHGWNRETFLSMTCRKAGVAEEAWRGPDCELLAFRAEIFED